MIDRVKLPIRVENRVDTMSDCEYGAVGKLGANRRLYELVCAVIYSRCGFVEYNYAAVSNKRTSQTNQLPLTNTLIKISTELLDQSLRTLFVLVLPEILSEFAALEHKLTI